MTELWIGMGCQEEASAVAIAEAIRQTLLTHHLEIAQVVGLATLEHKAPVAIQVCSLYHWELRTFQAAELALVSVPRPMEVVARLVGTASVAEAAAILAADYLLVPKQVYCLHHKFITIAISTKQL